MGLARAMSDSTRLEAVNLNAMIGYRARELFERASRSMAREWSFGIPVTSGGARDLIGR